MNEPFEKAPVRVEHCEKTVALTIPHRPHFLALRPMCIERKVATVPFRAQNRIEHRHRTQESSKRSYLRKQSQVSRRNAGHREHSHRRTFAITDSRPTIWNANFHPTSQLCWIALFDPGESESPAVGSVTRPSHDANPANSPQCTDRPIPVPSSRTTHSLRHQEPCSASDGLVLLILG